MIKEYSIAEGRNQLSNMVHQAEDGAKITLTRRGKPVAVLVSYDAFQRMISSADPNFWHAIQEFRGMTDFTDADLPDAELVSCRDRDSERDFSWRD